MKDRKQFKIRLGPIAIAIMDGYGLLFSINDHFYSLFTFSQNSKQKNIAVMPRIFVASRE